MQSMLSDGIAGRGLQREQKPIVLPNYGRDISIGEAIDSASNVKYTATTTLGIEFKIANDTDQSNTEHSKEISLRLAAFLLYYPNMLHGSLSMSDIVLNLDCGSGICGIAALQLGYTNVIFADPHEGVVRHAVWPNIWMNCEDKLVHSRCISSANWVALSEYLSDPGPNKWTVIYKLFGLVLATISTIRNTLHWEKLHSLLLRHLTSTGLALVGLHAAIAVDTPLPVPPYLRQCFEHSLLQSPACEGTLMCDIVRITRRRL